MFILAQIFGILIIVANALSMQMKKKQQILIMFILANLFSTINFVLLQSYSGAIICFVAIIQTMINYFFDKKKKKLPKWLISSYIIAFILCGLITYQTYLDILPILCSILYTTTIIQTREKNIRRITLINAILWLVYDFAAMAYTAGISDMVILISTLVGMYRFDFKKEKRKKIVVATNNQGKLKEIKEILKDYELVTLKEMDCKIEVDEDQETFEGNAKKKAEEIAKATNMPTLADDSGLWIEALGGWPGVYTARFLGENATDNQRNEAILEKMKPFKGKERKAKVVCVVAYYEDGKFVIGRGEVEGTIAEEPRGERGFGFDPIFEIANGKTYAEITLEEKNAISHRKRALENLQKQLTNQ